MTLALATVGYLQDVFSINLPPAPPGGGGAMLDAPPVAPTGQAALDAPAPPSGEAVVVSPGGP